MKKRIKNILSHMRDRCYNPNSDAYKDYGERGVEVFHLWLGNGDNFVEWALANGYDDELTIDRIDVDGNYHPDNCRWIPREQQVENVRLLQRDNKSGYRGVFFNKQKNKYQAKIRHDGKYHHLGFYVSAADAGMAYDEFVINNGLVRPTNF